MLDIDSILTGYNIAIKKSRKVYTPQTFTEVLREIYGIDIDDILCTFTDVFFFFLNIKLQPQQFNGGRRIVILFQCVFPYVFD